MSSTGKKVLVVDDEPYVRSTIRDVLQDELYKVSEAQNAAEAMALLAREQFDVVLMDIKMPGKDGIAALGEIRTLCPGIGIIMISGHGTIDNAVESIKLGAFDFLQKPFSMQRLKEAVANVYNRVMAGKSGALKKNEGVFGGYELTREIACGGTASVFEATQVSLNRKVALKILHQHLARDPQFITRFEREAKIVAQLSHPNIVSVYDYGEIDGRHFIAMEYVDGFSLESILSDEKPVTPRTAAAVVCGTAAALDYAHSRGVIHRDVKPGNILLTKTGEVKVTDFGFSRTLDRNAPRLTLVNNVVGTPLYMSPEQISGKELTVSTDMFSLGIVLYHLVTGVLPFTGNNHLVIMHNISEGDYVLPRKKNRKVPRDVENIIVTCLQKDCRARYPTMREVITECERYLAGCGVSSIREELASAAANLTGSAAKNTGTRWN
jgi:DNA-binding response OmpR family regulator